MVVLLLLLFVVGCWIRAKEFSSIVLEYSVEDFFEQIHTVIINRVFHYEAI